MNTRKKEEILPLPSYHCQRSLPENFRKEDYYLFSKELEKMIPGSRVNLFENALLLQDTIWDWKTLQIRDDLTHPLPLGWKAKLKRLAKMWSIGTTIEGAIWTSDYWAHNYFHWITESLTRLVCLREHFKDYVVILPEELKKYPYIDYTLKILGYNFNYLDPDKKLKARNLVSFQRTAPSFNYHPIAINLLREKFRQNLGDPPATKKIYISRAKASKRRIVNEDELFPFLEKENFEIHHFEDYSVEKQIKVMIEASHLVGIHGAGLTNMLYMRPGSKVFEFRFRGDTTNNCFFSLASELDHSYFYTQNEFETPKIHLNSNMILDIKKTRTILKLMNE